MIVNNYVLRITAVIIVYGDSIEVPTCGRAKISPRDTLSCIMCVMYTRAGNEAYPEVLEDFTIMEKAPTRAFLLLVECAYKS